MTENFAQKARDNRLAALAKLNGSAVESGNVISLFDHVFNARTELPQFRSKRARPGPIVAPQPQPLLILTDPIRSDPVAA
ncbi:MAG TPA: hypothetical protein ENK83_06995 [Aliiroseovarius sp.]|nr:hypothetical protein [Aliiroseovarius sp.]